MRSVNPSKLIFEAPRFPIDKIVFQKPGSFTIGSSTTNTTTITHDLNRKCLSEMIWTSDGVNYNDGGSEIPSIGVVQGCGLNTATIYGYNDTAGSVTINYTLYLIWPI